MFTSFIVLFVNSFNFMAQSNSVRKLEYSQVNDKILPNECWFKLNVIPKYRANQKCGYNKIKESLNGFYN